MRLRITFIALAVLAASTGCVAVPHTGKPGTPGLAPAGDRSTAPLEPRPTEPVNPRHRPTQAPVRETLAVTGPGAAATGAPARQHPEDRPVSAPRRGAQEPPARRARPAAERRAQPPRPRRPRPVVRAPRPRQTYDMRSLCAISDGIADPSLTELCRGAYGR
ncbi:MULTISPECIES: hypothetical protein [unclassified Streptomyces]|uniref:hypothetical protein n=1 Tax=unclassified Streptomyces TaxID=2593676 RepID=UPI0028C3CF25|nr:MULTISPECIES: hypothetical protein [unclassified Streptomyces]WNO73672.1 hypothetical protein RPQ07_19445 [Streptomyces sp. AM8-1-1]